MEDTNKKDGKKVERDKFLDRSLKNIIARRKKLDT